MNHSTVRWKLTCQGRRQSSWYRSWGNIGIDTLELRGDEREKGLKVRDFVRNLILNKKIIVRTIDDKKGKYGRLLAVILVKVDGKEINLNELLVKKGLAVEYMKKVNTGK